MNYDINNVLNTLSNEYAQQLAQANRKIAILTEELRILKEEKDEQES
jgi:hypothetical protein